MIEIGGISLPTHVAAVIDEGMEPITGAFMQRMENGTLRKQTHWTARKWRVRLSGSGTLSVGIHDLDYSSPVTVKLTAAQEILSASNIITLPTYRRSDAGYLPTGWARTGSKTWQETPASLVGDTLTLTVVPGAVQYRAIFYPELSVFSDGPAESRDKNAGAVSWTFEGEQI